VACGCRDCAINGGERQTKSGRARIVPVAPELRPRLLAYLAERSQRFGPDGWLFCRWFRPTKGRHAAGGQRLRRDVLAAFQRAADSAALADRKLRFHDLRNTAHTWLTERSRGHLVAVSVALGHRLPGMAETYNRLAADPVALARALFPDSVPAKLQLVS
jgi:integrase